MLSETVSNSKPDYLNSRKKKIERSIVPLFHLSANILIHTLRGGASGPVVSRVSHRPPYANGFCATGM